MSYLKKILLLATTLFFMGTDLLIEEPIKIATEDMKPFNYEENGEIKGTSTELVKKALKELTFSEKVEIKVYPWARCYQMATREKNVLIYSLVRVPPREKLFKWVAKVGTLELGVFRKKGRNDIVVTSIEDLKKYKLAVFIDSALQHYLEKKGITFDRTVGNANSLPQMLIASRIDLVPASVEGFYGMVDDLGYSRDEVELIFTFEELQKDLYAAFSQETSDEIVEKFRKAFQKVKAQEE